jgi:hypothetical protein
MQGRSLGRSRNEVRADSVFNRAGAGSLPSDLTTWTCALKGVPSTGWASSCYRNVGPRLLYQNTWFGTGGIAANRPSHFFALLGRSGEPFDTSTDRGRFGQPFRRGPITPLQWPPQVLEKAESKSVNSGGQKQMFLGRLLGGHARDPHSGTIFCMDDKPLMPGHWIDDLPEPLETEADVEELMRMVEEKKAKLKAEAILKAALN